MRHTPSIRSTIERLEGRELPSWPSGIGGGVPPVIPPTVPPVFTPPPIVAPVKGLAVGYQSGTDARVRAYQTATQFADFKAFANPDGYAVHVATGDVNGDGVPDIIVALGAGPPMQIDGYNFEYTGGNEVKVFNGATLNLPTPTLIGIIPLLSQKGYYVAAADFEGTGKADVVVSSASGVSMVCVYSGASIVPLGLPYFIATFPGIADPNFAGGASVATGDVNGDGVPDLVVGAGRGGGPRVAVFDGRSLRPGQTPRRLFNDFFAFNPAIQSGINVAVMDVNHDGRGDIIAGLISGRPEVVAIDGAALLASNGTTVSKYFDENLGDTTSSGGIEMVVRDFDGDGIPDLAVCHGDRTSVTVYRGRYFSPSGSYAAAFQFTAAPPSTIGGVWVG
jgi:hypothetical protein